MPGKSSGREALSLPGLMFVLMPFPTIVNSGPAAGLYGEGSKVATSFKSIRLRYKRLRLEAIRLLLLVLFQPGKSQA